MPRTGIQNREEFRRRLAEERRRFQTKASQAQRKLCLEATRRIVLKTPVDTGRARGNWQASIDTPVETSTITVDKRGGRTISDASRVIARMPPFHTFWLSNNLAYIEPLENGHSKQAPAGMVGVTIAELQAAGPSVLGGDEGTKS